jgi:hypothetical protein
MHMVVVGDWAPMRILTRSIVENDHNFDPVSPHRLLFDLFYFTRVFWSRKIIITQGPNVTNNNVILRTKLSLDVKLERRKFPGPNRENNFKAVSNKEFYL